jgi:hypothetical protein
MVAQLTRRRHVDHTAGQTVLQLLGSLCPSAVIAPNHE